MTPFQLRVFQNRWKPRAGADGQAWYRDPEKISDMVRRATTFTFAAKRFDDLRSISDIGALLYNSASSRDYRIFLPVTPMWIELVEDKLAALLIEDTDPLHFALFHACRLGAGPGVSLTHACFIDHNAEDGTIAFRMTCAEPKTDAQREGVRTELARTLMTMGALSVINEPALRETSVEKQSRSYAEAKHMKRAAPGQGAGAVTATVVTLIRGAVEARIAGAGARARPAGVRMCQHDVRTHLRTLRSGRVVTVRGHTRGDPALGIRTHSYLVKMAAKKDQP